jgi:hypothetical protein
MNLGAWVTWVILGSISSASVLAASHAVTLQVYLYFNSAFIKSCRVLLGKGRVRRMAGAKSDEAL